MCQGERAKREKAGMEIRGVSGGVRLRTRNELEESHGFSKTGGITDSN